MVRNKKKGSIINISSVSSMVPSSGKAVDSSGYAYGGGEGDDSHSV